MTREVIEQLEKTYKECVDLGQTCGKDSVFWKRAEAIKVALEQGDVLQEIRYEITNLVKTYPFVNHKDAYVKEDEVLEIIDKYKAESEVQSDT